MDSGNGLLLLGELFSHRLQSGLLLLLLSLESLVLLRLRKWQRFYLSLHTLVGLLLLQGFLLAT